MTGAWVTWSAEVIAWPGVDDITPQLDRAVAALPQDRYVDAASYHYLPGSRTVTFRLHVCSGITEVPVKIDAQVALRCHLPAVGLAMKNRDVGPGTVARLRFEWWPDEFDWWG